MTNSVWFLITDEGGDLAITLSIPALVGLCGVAAAASASRSEAGRVCFIAAEA
jgi:hypothetical protein